MNQGNQQDKLCRAGKALHTCAKPSARNCTFSILRSLNVNLCTSDNAIKKSWGMTIAPHLFPELNVHLLASIPNAAWAEQMGLLDDVWVEHPRIEAGMIHAPETPGHGLAFKPEVLRDFRV